MDSSGWCGAWTLGFATSAMADLFRAAVAGRRIRAATDLPKGRATAQ